MHIINVEYSYLWIGDLREFFIVIIVKALGVPAFNHDKEKKNQNKSKNVYCVAGKMDIPREKRVFLIIIIIIISISTILRILFCFALVGKELFMLLLLLLLFVLLRAGGTL